MLLLSTSRNSLQAPASDDILARNFTLSNPIILVEGLVSWKRGFEIFLIDHYTVGIGNKNITGSISVTHPILCWSVYTGAIPIILGSYNVCITYLHVIEACLKATIAMFCFCHSKVPSNMRRYLYDVHFERGWEAVGRK